MKKLIFLLLLLPLISFSQEGGNRSIKTISGRVYLSDQIGIQNRVLIVQPNGHISNVTTGTGYLKNNGSGVFSWEVGSSATNLSYTQSPTGGIVVSDTGAAATIPAGSTTNASLMLPADKTKLNGLCNYTVQSLSGTTPTWNIVNGINAIITISGNTTITLSNIPSGYSGNLTVINPSTLYTLDVNGYTNAISRAIGTVGNYTKINISGSSATDQFSFYYNGSRLIWNGSVQYITP